LYAIAAIAWARSAPGCDSKVARDIADEYFEVPIAPSTRVAQLWSQGLAPHVMCWDFEDA